MSTQIRERPIIFNTAMVQAILNGSKSQSRRVIKPQPAHVEICGGEATIYKDSNNEMAWKYQVGDRLWVREQFYIGPYSPGLSALVTYSDGSTREVGIPSDANVMLPGNHPSIHLPRWASRITLDITEVRVEKLNSMTESDAHAEGRKVTIEDIFIPNPNGTKGLVKYGECTYTAKMNLAKLWDSLNAKRGYGWEVKPWVWCITFKVIDA